MHNAWRLKDVVWIASPLSHALFDKPVVKAVLFYNAKRVSAEGHKMKSKVTSSDCLNEQF